MLELWELGGRDDCRFSTFSWRARLALHHKGLAFSVHPVAVSDKAAIGFSGQRKVPIVKHDGHVVTDSWAIALYLEKEFPERPTLFGGNVGQTLTQVFNVWADRELIPALIPFLMRDVLDCVSEADGAHLRAVDFHQNVFCEGRRGFAGAHAGKFIDHDLLGLDHLVFRFQ